MRPILPAFAAVLCLAAACDRAAETPDTAADAAPAATAEAPMSTPDAAPSPDAAVLGDADAPVTIVEYASTTCPHCAEFHATLFPHIKSEWIDTGRAKLVMRPLPTAPAQLAVAGFLLADCAADEAYFDVLGDLFETQDQLFAEAQAGAVMPYFEGVGARHGVSADQIDVCFGEIERLEKIEASIMAADADMVGGTPAFVINGQLHSNAELPDAAAWDAALQAALER